MTGEHLDDDALSATLDGEATPEEAAHVESCAACTARSAALRVASSAIGAPVVLPDEGSREAAIASAVRTLPTSLASRRRRPPPWALAVAAAVLVVAALTPVVLNETGAQDDMAVSSGQAAEDRAQDESLDSEESNAAPTAGGEPAAGGGPDAGPAGAAASPAPPAGLGEIQNADLRAVASSLVKVPAPTGASGVERSAALAAPIPCLDELVTARPDLGPLRGGAVATDGGRPVSVLVFEERETDPPRLVALVVLHDNCRSPLRTASFDAP